MTPHATTWPLSGGAAKGEPDEHEEDEYFVSDGISGGRVWATYRRRPNGSLERVKSRRLPLRPTREEAEHDLAAWLAERAPVTRQDRHVDEATRERFVRRLAAVGARLAEMEAGQGVAVRDVASRARRARWLCELALRAWNRAVLGGPVVMRREGQRALGYLREAEEAAGAIALPRLPRIGGGLEEPDGGAAWPEGERGGG